MPDQDQPINATTAAPAARPKPPGKWRRRTRASIAILSWFYLLLLLALWLVFRTCADRWWVTTLLLYGPRWLYALPLIVLLPLAVFGRRRSLGTLLISALLLTFPIMNLRLPWRRLMPAPVSGQTLRLLTLNTHEGALNARGLRDLIAATKPQIVMLQELDGRLAPTVFADGKWYMIADGELCLASRYPIRRAGPIGERKPGWSSYAATRFELDTPAGVVPLVNVHLSSPHIAFRNALHLDPRGPGQIEKNSALRQREARALGLAASDAGPAVVIAGDFNLPTDSMAYRANLASLTNAFDAAGFGFGFTYDVRTTVTRIDHVLTGSAWQCRRCWVGPNLGSPHHPLLADLEWTGGVLPPVPVVAAEAMPVGPMSELPAAPLRPAILPVSQPIAPAVSAPAPVVSSSVANPDPITTAVREHRLAIGMTIEQATAALAGWEGPIEVRATLDDGSKLFRWVKGNERIGAAFDATGQLRSFQKL